jgi:hypothetical protein
LLLNGHPEWVIARLLQQLGLAVAVGGKDYACITIVLFFSLIVGFYFLLLHKGKYKQTIKSKEKEYGGKRSFIAVLFPLIGFLLFNLGWILKMLQNQGKL